MNRIAYMVLKNIFHAPIWLFRVWRMGRSGDSHTDQEKYDYLRRVVTRVNDTGRITVAGTGVENLPAEEGFILFPNHQGMFDMLAIIEKCPHPVRVVIKKEAANVFLVKQVVELLKGLSMDRKDIRSSLEVIHQMSREVSEGKNYIIFAEGTRSKEGNEILKFKPGTFKSAVNARCPIVPVALINCYKPFDISSIKKEVVQVHFLDPIFYSQYMELKTQEIADIVHDRIQKKINENI